MAFSLSVRNVLNRGKLTDLFLMYQRTSPSYSMEGKTRLGRSSLFHRCPIHARPPTPTLKGKDGDASSAMAGEGEEKGSESSSYDSDKTVPIKEVLIVQI